MTPLYAAVTFNHTDCAKELISAGASVNHLAIEALEHNDMHCFNQAFDLGAIPSPECLVHASKLGHIDAVQFLISKGVDVNTSEWESSVHNYVTPVFIAIKHKHTKCAKQLVASGANLHQAIIFSIHYDDASALQLCLDLGAVLSSHSSGDALIAACTANSIDCLKYLLSLGVDINNTSDNWPTALHAASFFGNCSTVHELIKNGADINNQRNDSKTTPLMWTLSSDQPSNLQCLKLLLKSGAKVNVCDKYGNTPLIYAAILGDPEFLSCIISTECDVNRTNFQDATALMFVEEVPDFTHNKVRQKTCMKYLLNAGAKQPDITLKHACRLVIRQHAVDVCISKASSLLQMQQSLAEYVFYDQVYFNSW